LYRMHVMTKVAFNKLKELSTKVLKKDLQKMMVKTLVWPAALYGCERWAVKKEVVDKLKAFEMCMVE
jgi:hypothetical protein